jgi:bifunctional ADP-heptose synthase (sugar kinase/adenylyltransferase)
MTTAQVLQRIRKLRTLVVGDIRLDRLWRHDPELIEPGTARTAVISAEVALGAGGRMAWNAVELGAAQVAVLGVVGCDGAGYELEGALAALGISPELLVRTNLPTVTRTRLVNCRTSSAS